MFQPAWLARMSDPENRTSCLHPFHTSFQHLRHVQALASLTDLRIARLHANPDIKDVQPLSTLCNLTRLQLSQV